MGHRRRCRCHRRPKTTQERRENGKRNFIIWDEYKVSIRASRNMSNLVESRDDVMIGTFNHRCWKQFRKTQYK
jgi:hypothetical protein